MGPIMPPSPGTSADGVMSLINILSNPDATKKAVAEYKAAHDKAQAKIDEANAANWDLTGRERVITDGEKDLAIRKAAFAKSVTDHQASQHAFAAEVRAREEALAAKEAALQEREQAVAVREAAVSIADNDVTRRESEVKAMADEAKATKAKYEAAHANLRNALGVE